jgi:assimilatory nitrate reductase catalytic subunit
MGFGAAFDFANEAEIFREYAALSGLAGQFGRDFDISGLGDLTDADYSALMPQRWPLTKKRRGGRFFAEGDFYHPDGKARLVPVSWKPPSAKTSPRYPFRLNTGRVRDQWHTMTRTALSPRLSAHLAEPFLEIHPQDAQELSIASADLVELTSPTGQAILRARITDAVLPGQVFAPIHWTAQTAPSARIDAIVAAACDPVSGQPESKASVVSVRRYEAAWYGFAVSREEMHPDSDYWALVRTKQGYRAEMAGIDKVSDWETRARALFGTDGAELSSIIDLNKGRARIVAHQGDTLIGALFVSSEPVAVMRDYLATLPGTAGADALLGRPAGEVPNPGPVLCACLGVGVNTIIEAVETGRATSVDCIGALLGAGTNCGSCRPEIAELLQAVPLREAAE